MCCPAEIDVDGELLCGPCDDGTHAPLPEITKQSPALEPSGSEIVAIQSQTYDALHAMATALEATEVHLCPQPPQPGKEKSMPNTKPEIEDAIRNADPSESTRDLAERLNISTASVYSYQAKIRHNKAAGKSGVVKPKATPATKAERPGNATTRAVNLVDSFPVTLNLSAAALDAWWAARSSAEKARIFGSNFILTLEGFVS
jgi:hypothetical protein